ncbi:MAG: hypothetical protein KDC45_13915 [Bacteroidetes bacterium]|nr:hypothetical protein [Bacteroidota bacterium]
MRVFIIFVILIGSSSGLHASFDTKKGAKPLAMGCAYVGLSGSVESFYYNPAGLWLISYPTASGFYSTPYNLKELRTSTFGVAWPFASGTAGASVESYGFDLYRESTASVAWSGAIKQVVSFGVMVNYHHLAIKGGGDASTAGVDAGILLRPHEKIMVGFSARNINRPSIAGDDLPQAASLGISFQALPNWVVTADLYKDIRFPSDVRVGSEYKIADRIMLRGGLASDPSRVSGGLGIDVGFGQIDYAFYTHRELGLTHAVSLTYFFKRKPPRVLKTSL